jgi:hypothetical protein
MYIPIYYKISYKIRYFSFSIKVYLRRMILQMFLNVACHYWLNYLDKRDEHLVIVTLGLFLLQLDLVDNFRSSHYFCSG